MAQLSGIMRKTCLQVSDQVRHKPGCTVTEDGLRLEILDLGSIYVTNTKVLTRCTLTMQLICVFDFAYAKGRFSHDPAQF